MELEHVERCGWHWFGIENPNAHTIPLKGDCGDIYYIMFVTRK